MPVSILAIETSCDETAAAVVEDGRTIRSNVVASQAEMHARYGGIFPEAASRQHIRTIDAVVREAISQAGTSLDRIDALAVTRGPGLPGSLVVGINYAKGLSLSTGLPLIAVNHLEGHVFSPWVGSPEREPVFPVVALIVSGGHTELVLMDGPLRYTRLGGTLDDAAGEAFDKVARLLGLGFPGGPAIQKAAEAGDPAAFDFPRARLEGSHDFSFSGLKTAVLRAVEALRDRSGTLPVSDLAASFQEAVVDILVKKTLSAAETVAARSVFVVGGVSANRPLRERFMAHSSLPVFIPPFALCTDNAAMIGGAAYPHFRGRRFASLDFDARPNWPLN
ncbi:MAG TPA: tRNA (adenosine(37)-N6)-threonylcarbamoyltransferase complex transferase subunit TsaD [Anaerolineales bacterium]|nr:tRNA (adenosine(37)-N6)-threonylcarbamoyltransferase complex transferase subunit TsaD [Anaerolineales bacterium]